MKILEENFIFTHLVYLYFWHDKEGTITGCYECEDIYYDSPSDVSKHPKVMQDIAWALEKCRQRQLLDT